jgi:hypothetical protein
MNMDLLLDLHSMSLKTSVLLQKALLEKHLGKLFLSSSFFFIPSSLQVRIFIVLRNYNREHPTDDIPRHYNDLEVRIIKRIFHSFILQQRNAAHGGKFSMIPSNNNVPGTGAIQVYALSFTLYSIQLALPPIDSRSSINQIEIKHIVDTVALFLNLISITHHST